MTGANVVAILLAVAACGQMSSESPRLGVFRSDSRLILVSAIVTDRNGAAIAGLDGGSFRVEEGNAERRIFSFSEEDAPCSIGIVVDLSGSMRVSLSREKAGLAALLGERDPADEAMLLSVSDQPSIQVPFSGDFGTLVNHLALQPAAGQTALVDTVVLALRHMRAAQNHRKALVILSDGLDNNSRYASRELLAAVREGDVEIHTITLQAGVGPTKATEIQANRRGSLFLEEVAEASGGLHFAVQDDAAMNQAARNIGRCLHTRYVLGYRPSAMSDGKWHAIRVTTSIPNVRVHARRGYFSN